MSFQDIKPYFRARMAALDFRNEHLEAYERGNVPSSKLDRAFHIGLGVARGQGQNQTDLDILIPVTLTMFFKGFKDEETGRLTAMLMAERIITECLKSENRLALFATGIKDIRLNSFEAVPFSDSNDNVTELIVEFEALYIIGL